VRIPPFQSGQGDLIYYACNYYTMIVPTKTIQNISVPSIGLGTYDLRGKVCEEAIETALELGYRHIDTATMYANEESIGNALKRSDVKREELFITTKVWPKPGCC